MCCEVVARIFSKKQLDIKFTNLGAGALLGQVADVEGDEEEQQDVEDEGDDDKSMPSRRRSSRRISDVRIVHRPECLGECSGS